MRERGQERTFPPGAIAEADNVDEAPRSGIEPVKDLQRLLWCSIDNDDSRDLDQISGAIRR